MKDQVAKFERKEAKAKAKAAAVERSNNGKGKGKGRKVKTDTPSAASEVAPKKGKGKKKGEPEGAKAGKGKGKPSKKTEDTKKKEQKGKGKRGGEDQVEPPAKKRGAPDSEPQRDASPSSNTYLSPQKTSSARPWKVSPVAVKAAVRKARLGLGELESCGMDIEAEFQFPPRGFVESEKVILGCKPFSSIANELYYLHSPASVTFSPKYPRSYTIPKPGKTSIGVVLYSRSFYVRRVGTDKLPESAQGITVLWLLCFNSLACHAYMFGF